MDYKKAHDYYLQAAEQDYEEAFRWFKRAAEDETYAGALYNLAQCYEEGYGTKKNIKEAERLREVAEALEQDDCVEADVE